jgi:hypothetical protein
MPNKKWEWLEKRKQQERAMRGQMEPALAANSAVMPVGDRYNIGARGPMDTGYGEDGRLQTDMPVAMFNTQQGPRMVHEGEQLRPDGNGGTRVLSQAELVEIEKGKNLPGYRCGGKMKGYKGGGSMYGLKYGGTMAGSFHPVSAGILGYQQGGVMRPAERRKPMQRQAGAPMPGGTITDPTPDPIGAKMKGIKFDDPIAGPLGPKMGKQGIKFDDPINGPIDPQGLKVNPDIQGPPEQIIGDIGAPGQKLGPQGPLEYLPTPDPELIEGQKQKWIPEPPPTPTPDTGEPDYEKMYQDALDRMGQYGGYEKGRQKYMDQLAAQKATEQLVGAQRAAQRGLGGTEAATMGLMQQRMAGQELSGAFAETAIGAMNIAEQANLQKAALAMQGMQFDFAKQKYGDQEGQRLAADINAGMSYDQIRKKYPHLNITPEDYKQMQDYSPMGLTKEQWDYQKKVDALNQLLAQGGAENLQRAADLFNGIFGTDIDFSNALTEENQEKFNGAWNNMIGAISSGMSFEDWLKTAKADGTFDNLNMTEEDVAEMYGNMQLQNNPIYQAMQQLKQILANGDIDQEGYDRIMDALQYGLTHPEGFTFSTGYGIYDENGNEVKMFETEEKANQYLADNPDQGYTMKEDPEGIVKYTGGDSGTGPGGTTGDTTTIEGATDYLDSIGIYETDSERIQQFLDAHGGKIPKDMTAKQWNDWDLKTGSPSRIRNFLAGEGELTKADDELLAKIKDAQAKVRKGTATEEEKELANSIEKQFAEDWEHSWTDTLTGSTTDFYESNVGRLHSKQTFNNMIHQEQGKDYLSFTQGFLDWANANKGSVVEIDGQYYEIRGIKRKHPTNTEQIVSGNDTYEQQYFADGLVVYDPQTGEETILTFNASGKLSD